MKSVLAFLAGLLFSAGLCLSGMTSPSKVLAFLDVSGAWDPSLALVMAGAVAVSAIAFRVHARRGAPIEPCATASPPTRSGLDARLLCGAALFGLGWGMSGVCPGPAVTCLASGHVGVAVFVGSMLVGMAAYRPAVGDRFEPIVTEG
jgi:uncharacterized membrane protein YedE/YeeE